MSASERLPRRFRPMAAALIIGLFASGLAAAHPFGGGGGGHAGGGVAHSSGGHGGGFSGAHGGSHYAGRGSYAPHGYASPRGSYSHYSAPSSGSRSAAHYTNPRAGAPSTYRGGAARPGYGSARAIAPGRPGWHGGPGGYWRGRWWGGVWPLGMFFVGLPWYYETFWWGGIPYYYADSTFYRWNDGVGQYEVVAPPGDESSGAGPAAGGELYVYPQQGQSDEQQKQDRYDCYRWAADQTGFDPTKPDGGVNPGEAADASAAYRRAEGACLEGRGYTVR